MRSFISTCQGLLSDRACDVCLNYYKTNFNEFQVLPNCRSRLLQTINKSNTANLLPPRTITADDNGLVYFNGSIDLVVEPIAGVESDGSGDEEKGNRNDSHISVV
jgi:hypothetical protein